MPFSPKPGVRGHQPSAGDALPGMSKWMWAFKARANSKKQPNYSPAN
ncbi:hypothetical protein C942_00964 [Photobacterium marinum]|uniref:Uncharacterized protein n=1 Tax=Photobacterium marinum TaxID=1056511 RepID=L8JEN2_9GAMM|nr:hypothetical protein C942_00964 [Photobacterium marinum]